jgi:hypothetical protein
MSPSEEDHGSRKIREQVDSKAVSENATLDPEVTQMSNLIVKTPMRSGFWPVKTAFRPAWLELIKVIADNVDRTVLQQDGGRSSGGRACFGKLFASLQGATRGFKAS